MLFLQISIFIISVCSVFGQLVFPGFVTTPPNGACKTRTGQNGACKPRRECPRNNDSQRLSQQFCGFHNREIHICCRRAGAPAPLTKPNEVTAPQLNFQCGQRGSIAISFGSPALFSRRETFGPPGDLQRPIPRSSIAKRSIRLVAVEIIKTQNPDLVEVSIVKGLESIKNSWPWMALLGRKFGPSNVYFCSGTLINEQYIITAAHCVLDLAPFFVRLGEHDQSIPGTLKSRRPEDVNVADVIFHPEYEIDQGYHDIAILKLARRVSFRNEVQPICLPWGSAGNQNLVNEIVTVTGWGTEEFGGPSSNVLREVQVDVFEPSVCHSSYSILKDFKKAFPNGLNKKNIVCAGDEQEGKDACQGDSGGPMVHETSARTYFLAGVISKGYGCGKKGFPGLYAPIRNYETLIWIKETAFQRSIIT